MVEEMNESQEISILKNYTDHVIESFGNDKVMYGSNWPVCLTKKSYSEVAKCKPDYIVKNLGEILKIINYE